jgi:hypothetical protein
LEKGRSDCDVVMNDLIDALRVFSLEGSDVQATVERLDAEQDGLVGLLSASRGRAGAGVVAGPYPRSPG